MGTILENHGNGWMTIKFDGAPTCQDMWAPLDRNLITIVEDADARRAAVDALIRSDVSMNQVLRAWEATR